MYQQKLNQIETDALMPSSSTETSMYPTLNICNESGTFNPSDTVDSSLICKTEYFVQEPLPGLLGGPISSYPVMNTLTQVKTENFVDDLDNMRSISTFGPNQFCEQNILSSIVCKEETCHSAPDQPISLSNCEMQLNVKVSLLPTITEDPSQIYRNEYVLQELIPPSSSDQDLEDYSIGERSFKIKTENFTDDSDSMASSSSSKPCQINTQNLLSLSRCKREVHLILPDKPYNTSNTSSIGETPVDIKIFSSPIKPEGPLEDTVQFDDLPVFGAEKWQRSRRTKCKCPNCHAGPGKKVRDGNGKILHRCHIPDCGREFISTTRLKWHLDWHIGKKNCNKKFIRKDNLHTCHIAQCGKVFKRARNLKMHLQRHDSNKKWFCSHCNQGFSCKEYLVRHVKKHMNIMTNKRVKRRTCQCPNCSVESGNKTRDSNGKLQHVCHMAECGRVFRYNSNLKRHLESHSGKKNFACPQCNRKFLHKQTLTRHLKLHSTVSAQYACNIPDCGQVFSTSESLKSHLGLHTGKKNLVCPHCNKEFARKNNLSAHLRTHKTLK